MARSSCRKEVRLEVKRSRVFTSRFEGISERSLSKASASLDEPTEPVEDEPEDKPADALTP